MKARLALLLREPVRRRQAFTALSLVLAFFLPLLGWVPILLLWFVELLLSRRTAGPGMRGFYTAMLVLAGGLILWNLCARWIFS